MIDARRHRIEWRITPQPASEEWLQRFDGEIWGLRPGDDLESERDRPAVYFLIDRTEIVYVGCSMFVRSRIHAHLRRGIVFDAVIYGESADPLSTERAAIWMLHPRYNREQIARHSRLYSERDAWERLNWMIE